MASVAMYFDAQSRSGGIAWRTDWPVFAGLALFVLLVRGGWFGNPIPGGDEQLYSFIGWRMLYGELPFVDWWDRKPFGLFAIYALAHWLAGPEPIAYQAAAALVTFAGAVMTHALARPLADRAGAAIAAAFYVMLMSAYGSYSGQSEALHVPLMLLAALLVANWQHRDAARRSLCAMAVCGLALQVKYTVLPQCIFLGLWALLGAWRRGAEVGRLASLAGAFAALGLLPTAAIGLFYLALGEWQAFYQANFLSFFAKAAAPAGRFDHERALVLLPLAVLLAGGLYSVARVKPARDPERYLFYAGWGASALATVLLPKTVHEYYYAAMAPCAALLATPLFDRRSLAGMAPTIVLLAFWVYILFLPGQAQRSALEQRAVMNFAAIIAPHVSKNECLYVLDGPTALYRLTGGCVPTRFVYPDHLTNGLEEHALGTSQTGEVKRILATEPAAIVTSEWPALGQNLRSFALARTALRQEYRLVGKVKLHVRVYQAWVRREP